MLTAVTDSYEDGDGAVASVYVGLQGEDEEFEDAVKRVSLLAALPHGRIRVALAGDLLDAGFEIVQDTSDGQPSCHHNVVFTEPPQMSQAMLFLECFGPPIANPAKD